MSNLMGNQARPGLPTPPRGDTIASYRTYLEAQRAVDFLSDRHFPVQAVTIVGVDLQMVERVTGRLTYARVALMGLASGAWFGLFVGLLISFVSDSTSWLAAVPLGAAFGMAFSLFSYALTGGRRDFTSTSQIVASEYRVLCLTEQAGQAMALLRELEGGAGLTNSAQPGPRTPDPAPPPPTYGQPSGPTPGPTSGQAYGQPPAQQQWGPPPAAHREEGAPPQSTEQAEPPVPSGPTYGEMMERRRKEERERAEAEARREAGDQS